MTKLSNLYECKYKPRLTKCVLDTGDRRFAARAVYKHFSDFEFFLLPNRVHARLADVKSKRWAAEHGDLPGKSREC
jgi:hypothetical protein